MNASRDLEVWQLEVITILLTGPSLDESATRVKYSYVFSCGNHNTGDPDEIVLN